MKIERISTKLIEILIGVTAGILGVSGFIYQTLKNPIGMTYPIIVFTQISVGLWAGYGLSISEPIIYVPNIIIVIMLTTIGVRKLKCY